MRFCSESTRHTLRLILVLLGPLLGGPGFAQQAHDDEVPPEPPPPPPPAWGDAAEYFHPPHERHASVVGSMALLRPRDLANLEARAGGRLFEVAGEFSAANPRTDEYERSRVHLIQLRAGHVRRAWAYGGTWSLFHLRTERDDSYASRNVWSSGAGTYLRFGAEHGLHFTGSLSLLHGGREEFTLIVQMEMRIPLLRHRAIELDVIGKVWSAFGEEYAASGMGELRARIAKRVSLGVGVTPSRRATVGYRHIGVGLSLGVHLL